MDQLRLLVIADLGLRGRPRRPARVLPQKVPVGLADFGWMFAIGGLGIALTLGIFSRIAGWGGFLLW